MSTEFWELNLEDDLKEVMSCPEVTRWQVEKSGELEVLVTMSPLSEPEEKYQARLLWAEYPGQAPSLKFRDPGTGRLDMPSAWPIARGFRPASLDACVSWCLEGFNLHPEWKNDPRFRWDPRGNVLLKVLRILQGELDDHYQRRFGK